MPLLPFAAFARHRVACRGSAGDYAQVWAETNKALEGRAPEEIDAVLGGTAARFYKL